MDSPPGREFLDWARNLSEGWWCGKPYWNRIGNPVECLEIPQGWVRELRLSSASSALRPTTKFLGLEWPRDVTLAERRSLIEGGLGWMLDAFDVGVSLDAV
jgi:hypothetical protein